MLGNFKQPSRVDLCIARDLEGTNKKVNLWKGCSIALSWTKHEDGVDERGDRMLSAKYWDQKSIRFRLQRFSQNTGPAKKLDLLFQYLLPGFLPSGINMTDSPMF